MIDRETYCNDCDRSIHGRYHDCDINIENEGRYVKGDSKCYCKIVNGKRAEKYPWEKMEDAPVVDRWIPVTEKMPEEHDTMFAKYWGTDRWNKYMFRKRSDLVEVTVELDDGTRVTEASRTRDGKWAVEDEHGFVHKKVVAWHPMSEPWKGELE